MDRWKEIWDTIGKRSNINYINCTWENNSNDNSEINVPIGNGGWRRRNIGRGRDCIYAIDIQMYIINRYEKRMNDLNDELRDNKKGMGGNTYQVIRF